MGAGAEAFGLGVPDGKPPGEDGAPLGEPPGEDGAPLGDDEALGRDPEPGAGPGAPGLEPTVVPPAHAASATKHTAMIERENLMGENYDTGPATR